MSYNASEARDHAGKWTKGEAEAAIKALKTGSHLVGPNGAHVHATTATRGRGAHRVYKVNHANTTKTYDDVSKAAAHAARAPKAAPARNPDMLTMMNNFMKTSPSVNSGPTRPKSQPSGALPGGFSKGDRAHFKDAPDQKVMVAGADQSGRNPGHLVVHTPKSRYPAIVHPDHLVKEGATKSTSQPVVKVRKNALGDHTVHIGDQHVGTITKRKQGYSRQSSGTTGFVARPTDGSGNLKGPQHGGTFPSREDAVKALTEHHSKNGATKSASQREARRRGVKL